MDGLKRFVQTDPWKWCRDDTFKPHRERESNLSFFGGFSDFRYYDSKQFRRFCQHSTSFLRVFSSKQVECSANPAQVFCKRSASVSPDSSTSQQYSSELLSRQKLPRIFLPLVTSLFVADRFFSTARIGTVESKTAFLFTRDTRKFSSNFDDFLIFSTKYARQEMIKFTNYIKYLFPIFTHGFPFRGNLATGQHLLQHHRVQDGVSLIRSYPSYSTFNYLTDSQEVEHD